MIINGSGTTARRRLGDGAGTRALIGVLLLHRTLPTAAVLAGIDAALTLDSCRPRPGRGRGPPRRATPSPCAAADRAGHVQAVGRPAGARRWPATTSCWLGATA